MKGIKELKWRRMLYILEQLRQQPLTLDKIVESLTKGKLLRQNVIGRRSIQNYMEELCAIKVVSLDSTSGNYRLVENDKQVFESKHDYQIALTHSKNLLFSNDRENTQRFDHINAYLAIDLLVFEPERDADDFAIMQHLRTGYPEIYEILSNYHRLMDQTGLSKRGCLPKLNGDIDFFDSDRHFFKISDNSETDQDENQNYTGKDVTADTIIAFSSGCLGDERITIPVKASIVKEISDLRDSAVVKIYGHLMNAVRNGTPLKGTCDFCPRGVNIKGKTV